MSYDFLNRKNNFDNKKRSCNTNKSIEEIMKHIERLTITDRGQLIQDLERQTTQQNIEEEVGICLICGEESYHPNSQTCQRDGTCFNQGLYEDLMPEDRQECVHRFLEMVREKCLTIKKCGKGKEQFYIIENGDIILEDYYSDLYNNPNKPRTRSGYLTTHFNTSINTLLGWTRSFGKSQKRKCYDMINKPEKEIYDIIDSIIQYNRK